MSYYSFGYRNKRSRNITICEGCEEEEIDTEDDYTDWAVCGDCERTLCEFCCRTQCQVCKETIETGSYEKLKAENPAICEMCEVSCDDCDALSFHKDCLVEHLKTCNKKSRAQRSVAATSKTLEQCENDLEEAKAQLAALQNRVVQLEMDVADALEKKTKAEQELKAESTKK